MRRRPVLGGWLALAAGASALARVDAPASSATASRRQPLPMPPPLVKGSQVMAIAPGTWWEDAQREGEGLRARFAAAGWTLTVPAAIQGRWRWFSEPDGDRLSRLTRAMADPAVAAVVSVAGGWGSARLLERGWRPPSQPRWLVGYSDASALLLAQWAAGVGGAVHGSPAGDADQWERLRRLLRGFAVAPLQGAGWQAGIAVGPLVVSNLTVATSLIGTPWFPPLAGCVLVLEDVGEEPYRVDRMLTQWRSSGALRGVVGVGLGHFRWKGDDILPGDLSMDEVLRDRLSDLGVPLVGQLPVGHGRPNLALPLGRLAQLDGERGTLALL
ncbi:MAG: LD-carboxypeptidase [Cyanobacteriota bacterium]|nr:LD-carboxypeptidase [Cyanobacteriota bacterium]